MKIGLSRAAVPPLPPQPDLDGAFLGREAERLGFESLWCGEHGVSPVQTSRGSPHEQLRGSRGVAGYMDPLIALARASAVTTRLKLGTGILILPQRNPFVLAKELATLDFYSGGRFLLGIGTGWNKGEADLMGVDFEHRWSQAREEVAVLKGLWTQPLFEFHGKYFNFDTVACEPKPAPRRPDAPNPDLPHPPVYLGGKAPNLFKRIVAYGDGWVPFNISPTECAQARAMLDELAVAAGRDPKGIELSIYLPDSLPTLGRALFRQYEDAGADRLVLMPEKLQTEAEATRVLERLAGLAFG